MAKVALVELTLMISLRCSLRVWEVVQVCLLEAWGKVSLACQVKDVASKDNRGAIHSATLDNFD